ncbi:MAG: hypothetical protein P9X26_08420 [Candidatus Stygibacter frigidus]|nr:hypothetical protein [Candidatus Stygibacter frigidus]
MNKIEKEEKIKELRSTLEEIKGLLNDNKWQNEKAEHEILWKKMVDLAIELHAEIKPIHHKKMIENRGFKPDNPKFYDHIHPVEDLLAFIEDPKANNDPEDITMNHEFYLNIYTRRWGHDDKYKITRNEGGWFIGNISLNGNCDKTGSPYLYENLRHDLVNYPHSLPGYLDFLWDQASEQGLSHEGVQEALDQLSSWIKTCEIESPKGIWESY